MTKTNPIQPSEEKALHAMQHAKDMSPEELDNTCGDDDCMELCAEMARLAMGIHQEENPFRINAAEELARFKGKHRKKAILRYTGIVGIAAALLTAVFLVAWPRQEAQEAIVIYKAVAVTQPVTIQSSDMDAPKPLAEFMAKQAASGVQYQADSLRYPAEAPKRAETAPSHTTYVLNVPRGESFRITLSDGTEVLLSANSRLTYPNTFGSDRRTVSIEGEAYFSVAHQPERPFVVTCGETQVQVLGTEFNIKNPAGQPTEITLVEGKVALNSRTGKHLIDMVPGQRATVTDGGKVTTDMVDTEYLTYWKQGYFYFDNVTLADMMRKIGEWYNVDVVFESGKITNLHMHFFADRNQDIQHIIERLNHMQSVYAYMENGCLFVR